MPCIERSHTAMKKERRREKEKEERATMYYQICQYYQYASVNRSFEMFVHCTVLIGYAI